MTFPNICYSKSVFWRNVYDIKNVTFGIKTGQKFYHLYFNIYTSECLFLSNSLYLYYKIIKQPHKSLVRLIEMNTREQMINSYAYVK